MLRKRFCYSMAVLFFMCSVSGRTQARSLELELTSPYTAVKSCITYSAQHAHLPAPEGALRDQPGNPSVMWIPFSIAWHDNLGATSFDLKVVEADTLQLDLPLATTVRDQITSDTAPTPCPILPNSAIYLSDQWYPSSPVRLDNFGLLGGVGVVSASWCPLVYHPLSRRLIVIKRAILTVDDGSNASVDKFPSAPLPITDALLEAVSTTMQPNSTAPLTLTAGDGPSWTLSAGVPIGVEYVIVTKSSFVAAMKPLALWKARKGIKAGIATIEDITSQFAGVDPAESVREFLKTAYATGLKWVVIGGDETVAPTRLAYAEFPVYDGDLYKLQQCDLYFAELDGNWDADADGIWGEFFGDQAQMQPELYVGRLPYSTVSEAQTIVNKIIAYERGPSQAAYLTKSLSVSTDQFRDWSSGTGQHGVVAGSMPPAWTHDLSSMIEAPTGSDPVPSYPDGTSFGGVLAAGAGWVNYFVHGRTDGFVVRSAGIMEWPRSYVFTNGSGGDGNGYLNLAPPSSLAGIHLSAGCDQGGFDLNSAPYSLDVGESVAEKLLFMPGGAVAFVGQSRWGWVSTSYKIIQKFYDYVNNTATPNHIGVYQTLSKLAFSSYRDLVYGNNLYGDPEMPVWRSAPIAFSAYTPETFSPGTNSWTVRAVSGSTGIAGATFTVAIGDSVWILGQSGADGTLASSVMLPSAASAVITASKIGYRVWADTIPMSIVSGVFDDADVLPVSHISVSNYPNPFNSETVIAFALPTEVQVKIDVYDVLGRRVRTILDAMLLPGDHRVTFDGTNDAGVRLSTGVYFARIVIPKTTLTRAMVILK